MMLIFIPTLLLLLTDRALSSADLGLNIGSRAAGKLATHCLHYALRQPRQLHLNLQSSTNPWFDRIAHIQSRTKLSLTNFTINFQNDAVELSLYGVTLKSTSNINVIPLPFFLGEDTAHVYAEIPHARLKLDFRDVDVKLQECVLQTSALEVSLDRAFLLNFFLRPLHHFLPSSLIEESLCSSISDPLLIQENRIALEIGLSKLVPDKFQEYLVWPNSTLLAQLATAEAQNDLLSLRVAVDWENNAGVSTSTEEAITVLDPATQIVTTTTTSPAPIQPPPPAFFSTGLVTTVESGGIGIADSSQSQISINNDPPVDSVAPASAQILPALRDIPLVQTSTVDIGAERITAWIEDELLNDLFQQFRWDFEWMAEEIPVESPKLPAATREFLSTLCTNCYFALRVAANGPPHVMAVNESIVLEKSDSIFLKVVNPVRNVTSVFVSFYLTLNIKLQPTIDSGIFKTQVDLLNTDIKMERGAFPSSWNFFVQDLVKGMIMDVIWPGLKKEIEILSYSDGVEIPSTCGIEPSSAQLHFENERFGASTALQLDDVSLATCLQQLKSKLPDPSSLLVIKESK